MEQKTLIISGVIFCVILVVLITLIIVKSLKKKDESYTSLVSKNVSGGYPYYQRLSEFGEYENAFAPKYEGFDQTYNEHKTIERLDRLDGQLLPKVSTNITPYDVDVADPISYSFQVHAPRVIRKDRLAMEADPYRGDIPITIYPDIPIVGHSRFNRDSLRLDGAFSEALSKSYDRLTGKTNFNQPSYISHGDLLM